MAAFMIKSPFLKPRALDINDCPPHGVLHDVAKYPSYYDPLYHPEFHPAVFAMATGFCTWLEPSLIDHVKSCSKCASSSHVNSVTFDGKHINISITGTSMLLAHSHFEHGCYVHCSIFQQCECSQGELSMEGILSKKLLCDPPWLSYSDDDVYRENLSELPAKLLCDVARTLGYGLYQTRNKDLSIHTILQHFTSRCRECSLSLNTSVLCPLAPPNYLKVHATVVASEVINLYGVEVATALCQYPAHSSTFDCALN
jgi:hypothetical protein